MQMYKSVTIQGLIKKTVQKTKQVVIECICVKANDKKMNDQQFVPH